MSTPHTAGTTDTDDVVAAGGAFEAALIEFITESVALTDDVVEPDTDLLLTGLVDSLGVVMIVGWIEAELDVAVDPGDVVLDNFQTVAQMVAFAATLTPATRPGPPSAPA